MTDGTTTLRDKLTAAVKEMKLKGISHAPKKGLQRTLDFQDLIGRAQQDELYQAVRELAPDVRRDFIWVMFNTLSQDVALDILKMTTCRDFVEKLRVDDEAQLEARHAALLEREMHCEKRERETDKRVADAKAETAHWLVALRREEERCREHAQVAKELNRQLEAARAEAREAAQRVVELQDQMEDFAALKRVIRAAVNEDRG